MASSSTQFARALMLAGAAAICTNCGSPASTDSSSGDSSAQGGLGATGGVASSEGGSLLVFQDLLEHGEMDVVTGATRKIA